jgi:fatty-acyl-CoA synthase
MGLVVVAVNTRFRSSEVADIVGRSGARTLVVDPSFLGIDFAGILARIEPDALGVESIISISGEPVGSWPTVAWSELAESAPSTVDRSDPLLPYAVFTTSGTTSAPKLVMHRQDAPARHADDLAPLFGEVALLAVPLCGVFGFTVLLGALGRGSAVVTLPVFDGGVAALAVEQHSVETFHGSDEMLARMIETGRDLSSLGSVGYARFNNALESVDAEAAEAGVTAVGLYGMSEVHALYALRTGGDPARASLPGGRLVSPSASARVVDPATSETLPLGASGELQLRGPSLFAGYLSDGGERVDDELTARHFDEGWFRTGDLARMEDDRTFEYLARMGDVLRLGGFLVNPAEIEDVLLADPSVEAVQVVGVDRVGGPRAVAFVVGPVPIDEDALQQRCRLSLATYKVPARVMQLDEFPTTPSANGTKIQKVALRELAARALDT